MSKLSDRETEVLRLVKTGLTNRQIGHKLGIAEGTVKVHVGSAMRKIGVTNRTAAAMWAMQNLGEAA